MSSSYTDAQLVQKISELQTAIQAWAEARELWHDCGFAEFLSHVGAEPGSPAVVTVLWSEGGLNRLLMGEFDAEGETFDEFLDSLGYWYDTQTTCTFNIHVVDEDLALNAAFESYFRWQWICSLVQPDKSLSMGTARG